MIRKAIFVLGLVLPESLLLGQELVPMKLERAWVGCVEADTTCPADEKPGGQVNFQPFSLDAHEVTVAEYRLFVAATGRHLPPQPLGSTDQHPVVNVRYEDAAAYCAFVGKRLPTEAEWEAAARGTLGAAIFPSGAALSHGEANFFGVGGKDRFPGLAPVGSFPPNSLGLYDMAGNAWEWTADDFLPRPPQSQQAAVGGKLKVVKGGSWRSLLPSLRVSNRGRLPAATVADDVGFRCGQDGAENASSPEQGGKSEPPAKPSPEPIPSEPQLVPSPAKEESPGKEAKGGLQEKLVGPAQVPMVFLPAGSYERGCVKGDSQCTADEQPRREIRLSAFAIGKTEVTVGQYWVFSQLTGVPLPDQPTWSGQDFPVTNVTWEEAQAFCQWLGGRLPTEAEWEYAARGGRAGQPYPAGQSISHQEANFDGVEGRDRYPKAAPVASFPANGYGLFDMLGNVWEWCLDWYQEDYYAASPEEDPVGPGDGEKKVVRGGSFTSDPGRLRLSYRSSLPPAKGWIFTGFRCALPQGKP